MNVIAYVAQLLRANQNYVNSVANAFDRFDVNDPIGIKRRQHPHQH